MIGLFLGDTDFSKIVLKKIKKLKKKHFIIDFSKNNVFAKEKNAYRISIGKFGKIIDLIKKQKSNKVLFAGKIGVLVLFYKESCFCHAQPKLQLN